MFVTAGSAFAAQRDRILIVSSGTLYPYMEGVSRQLTRSNFHVRTPALEYSRTASAVRFFCAGVGIGFPDIVAVSRAMSDGENEFCRKHGVATPVKLVIGYDGIVIASGQGSEISAITREELYNALTKYILSKEKNEADPNPYSTWDQINPELPKSMIRVFGTSPGSGTFDTFVEQIFFYGCGVVNPAVVKQRASQPKLYRDLCQSVRDDGAFVSTNFGRISSYLEDAPSAVGLLNYGEFLAHTGSLTAVAIDGVIPTVESIGTRQYPLARPLYVYLKVANIGIVAGVREFIDELLSERAIGPTGYLAELGLVALPEAERRATKKLLDDSLAPPTKAH